MAVTTNSPTAIDLFCGGGGISLGLQAAGFDVLWAADSDADAVTTYRTNLGDTTETVEQADLSETGPESVLPTVDPGELDLVAGGPPCPTFSMMGRSKLQSVDGRSAASDERHSLYQDFIRFVDHFQPTAVAMENVPGMLSAKTADGEQAAQAIRREFAVIGYEVDVFEVDAADYGVPQHRNRVFFIGTQSGARDLDLDTWRTHREPESDSESMMRVRQEPDAFSPSDQATLATFGDEEAAEDRDDESALSQPSYRQPYVTVADAILDLPPLSPKGEKPPVKADEYTIPAVSPYQEWARDLDTDDDSEPTPLTNHEAREHNLLDLTIYKLLGEGVGWNIGDVSTDLQPYRGDVFLDKYKKQHPRKPASTILAHIHKDGHMFIHPREARSLSVREAARLQGFKDSFEFPVSRTQAYKIVGNAVPPLLMETIARAIRAVLLSSE